MSDTSTSIQSVIRKVKDGVYAATQDDRFDPSIEIVQLELNLVISASLSVAAGVKQGVLSFIPILKDIGGNIKLSEQNTQTISIILQRPTGIFLQGEYVAEKIEEQLRDAIISIIEGIQHADDEPVILNLLEASVELKFELTRSGDIAIVVVEEGLTHNKAHTLKLTLKKLGATSAK